DSGSGPSDHPGMTVVKKPRSAAPSGRDDLLALLAEAVDAECDDVTDIEEGRRLHAKPNAGWRTCGEDVAGQERHELRDIGDAFGHREDHGRSVAGLPALAV